VKVAIHQPHYLPWLGYLAKWAAADLFVFLDTVQYEKSGWQNRNRIKTRDGARWLTVPVRARLGTPIRAVQVDENQPWQRRHLGTIEQAYGRTRAYGRFVADLQAFYEKPWDRLAPLAVASAMWLARAVGITTPVRLASELPVKAVDATDRLVAICQAVGATVYLAGRDGATYMDVAAFTRAGIEVQVQAYTHPIYPQINGEFVPFLSGLDLLLNSADDALAIVRSGDSWTAVRAEAAPD
jgi:hypothetical protein